MLPKKNRLNLSNKEDKSEFKALFELSEIKVKHKNSQEKKGAVVVSKAVAKKATDRNRIKRTILEAFKKSSIVGEFIFIVKKNIASTKAQDHDELFEKIKKKLSS